MYENCPEALLSGVCGTQLYSTLETTEADLKHSNLVYLLTNNEFHRFRYFDFLARTISTWPVSFAKLHYDCGQKKPIASTGLKDYLQRVSSVALALSDVFIRQDTTSQLDHSSRIDQVVFCLYNAQFSPDAITDSPRQHELAWQGEDPLAACTHTVLCALVETLSDQELYQACCRHEEIGLMPSLSMILASVRGRGCRLLLHPKLSHQLKFGVNLDKTNREEVFSSPLFLLLRPFWRLGDVDDETARYLSDAFEGTIVPRMTHINPDYFGGQELEDCFVARYLSTVDLPPCFNTFCTQVSTLAEKHIQAEIGPPPTFVRITDYSKASIASSSFRRGVVSLLVHAHSTGHIYNGTDCLMLSLFVTSSSTHCFVRVLTRHTSRAANDPVTASIRYEDSLRQALHNLSNSSELTISHAKHPRPYVPFSELMQSVVFLDATSAGLWKSVKSSVQANADATYRTVGRLDPAGSRYGACTCMLSLEKEDTL